MSANLMRLGKIEFGEEFWTDEHDYPLMRLNHTDFPPSYAQIPNCVFIEGPRRGGCIWYLPDHLVLKREKTEHENPLKM